MKLRDMLMRLRVLEEQLGPEAEVVVYDTEDGKYVTDIEPRIIGLVMATMPIEDEHPGLRWDVGDLIEVDDVTRPLVEGKSMNVTALEITF